MVDLWRHPRDKTGSGCLKTQIRLKCIFKLLQLQCNYCYLIYNVQFLSVNSESKQITVF